jgi:L-fucose mutarotase
MGLLKGIDPLLTADILHILRSMGHGDKLCICDCNFPAAQIATSTTSKKHILLTVTLPQALDAICSVLPLDFFEAKQAMYMSPQEGVEMPPAGMEVVSLMKETIVKHCGDDTVVEGIERFSFYEEAKSCFAVIQCLERRPYGNVILVKGCVGPDGNDLKP